MLVAFFCSYYEKYNDTNAAVTTPQQQVETTLTEYKLDQLLPGRRYNIEVQALSNGVSSNGTSLIRDTRPAAPIIQELRSINQGLNISWRSDVTSQQDRYEVHYQRNGTKEERTISTNLTNLIIKYLHPGSGYEIKVYAISHEMRSEPHAYFQAVCKC